MEDRSAHNHKYVMTILGVILTFAALYLARTILIPLFFSIIFAFLLYPLNNVFEEKLKLPRSISIFLTIIIAIAVVAIILILLISQLSRFVQDLPQLMPKLTLYLDQFKEYVKSKANGSINVDQMFDRSIVEVNQSIKGFLSEGIYATGHFITALVIVPVYVFLFLYYRDMFKDFFIRVSPPQQHSKVEFILRRIRDVIQNYMIGVLIVICILAVLNLTTLLVFQIKYAVFFAIVAAILNIIPYIGVFIGSTLPIIMALITKDSMWYAIGIFICFTLIQFLEGNVITPNIVGSKVRLNPLTAIIALIIGGTLWGVAGMILFIPLSAIIKVICDSFEPLHPYGFILGTRNNHEHHPIKHEGLIHRVLEWFR